MILLKLALRLLRFEWRVNIVLIAALAAVLAPLMLLWSLRSGVISNLEHQIINNPANFEITLRLESKANEVYAALVGNEHVGFMITKPASLNTSGPVISADDRRKNRDDVPLIPTGAGDPLMERSGIDGALADDEIVLSTPLARTLERSVGDRVIVQAQRRMHGQNQAARVEFRVAGIVEQAFDPQQNAYLSKRSLTYFAAYKSGEEPPLFGDGSDEIDLSKYEGGVRIYARGIDSVIPLTETIRSLGKEISGSKVADIVNLKAVDAVLTSIFLAIVVVSAVGGVIAFFGLIHLNLHNRSRTMAMLLLMGMDKLQLTIFTALKNAFCGVLAFVLSLFIYQGGAAFLNSTFSTALSGAQIASLGMDFMLWLLLITEGLVLAISVLSMYLNYAKKQTAQLLRD